MTCISLKLSPFNPCTASEKEPHLAECNGHVCNDVKGVGKVKHPLIDILVRTSVSGLFLEFLTETLLKSKNVTRENLGCMKQCAQSEGCYVAYEEPHTF